MREYLPLLFEALIAGAVIVWGVRQLMVLNKDEKNTDPDKPDTEG